MRGSVVLLLLLALPPAALAQRRGGGGGASGGVSRNVTLDVPALCGAVKSGCNLLSV
jgi:hypothetical protein